MRTVGTAERAAFQTIFHRYVSPHSRVIKNKGEKLIFRNEAAMSSQVNVFRTMSGDNIAITLLLTYQSCGILLFDSLLSLMSEQLITMILSFAKYYFIRLCQKAQISLKLAVVFTTLHCYIS